MLSILEGRLIDLCPLENYLKDLDYDSYVVLAGSFLINNDLMSLDNNIISQIEFNGIEGSENRVNGIFGDNKS